MGVIQAISIVDRLEDMGKGLLDFFVDTERFGKGTRAVFPAGHSARQGTSVELPWQGGDEADRRHFDIMNLIGAATDVAPGKDEFRAIEAALPLLMRVPPSPFSARVPLSSVYRWAKEQAEPIFKLARGTPEQVSVLDEIAALGGDPWERRNMPFEFHGTRADSERLREKRLTPTFEASNLWHATKRTGDQVSWSAPTSRRHPLPKQRVQDDLPPQARGSKEGYQYVEGLEASGAQGQERPALYKLPFHAGHPLQGMDRTGLVTHGEASYLETPSEDLRTLLELDATIRPHQSRPWHPVSDEYANSLEYPDKLKQLIREGTTGTIYENAGEAQWRSGGIPNPYAGWERTAHEMPENLSVQLFTPNLGDINPRRVIIPVPDYLMTPEQVKAALIQGELVPGMAHDADKLVKLSRESMDEIRRVIGSDADDAKLIKDIGEVAHLGNTTVHDFLLNNYDLDITKSDLGLSGPSANEMLEAEKYLDYLSGRLED
jgi:hypothetical protein